MDIYKKLQKTTFLCLGLVILLVLLQHYVPKLKQALSLPKEPQIIGANTTNKNTVTESNDFKITATENTLSNQPHTADNTQIQANINSKDSKFFQITEEELNKALKNETPTGTTASTTTQNTSQNVQINIYEGFISISTISQNNEKIVINITTTEDKKALKLENYNFVGYQNYSDEVKKQLADVLSQAVMDYIKQQNPNTPIKEILIRSKELDIVYF